MNFAITREFDCYRQSLRNICIPAAEAAGCMILQTDTGAVRQAQANCYFAPSWQNSIDSIVRGEAGLTCLGAFIDGKMVGHCVFDAATGDLTQIAVKKEYRRRSIASRLLREAVACMKTDFIKVLNIPSGNPEMAAFLKRMNIAP